MPQVKAFLYLELSSQVQQRIEEHLKGRLPVEAFAWTSIEFGNEGCDLMLIKVLHINRLGTVFTDEAVCVFIRATFPWCMGLRKVKGHTVHCIGYLFMKRKLFSAIWRNRKRAF